MTTTPPPSGPISLADVRQALADTDPSGTNAGALRKIMGRGSCDSGQELISKICFATDADQVLPPPRIEPQRLSIGTGYAGSVWPT